MFDFLLGPSGGLGLPQSLDSWMVVLMNMVQYCTVSYIPGAQGGSHFFGLSDFSFWCGDITVQINIKNYIAEFCVSVINTSCPVPLFVTVILSHDIVYLAISPKFFFRRTLVSAVPSTSVPHTRLATTGRKLASTPYTVCIVTIHISFLILSPSWQDSSR